MLTAQIFTTKKASCTVLGVLINRSCPLLVESVGTALQ